MTNQPISPQAHSFWDFWLHWPLVARHRSGAVSRSIGLKQKLVGRGTCQWPNPFLDLRVWIWWFTWFFVQCILSDFFWLCHQTRQIHLLEALAHTLRLQKNMIWRAIRHQVLNTRDLSMASSLCLEVGSWDVHKAPGEDRSWTSTDPIMRIWNRSTAISINF